MPISPSGARIAYRQMPPVWQLSDVSVQSTQSTPPTPHLVAEVPAAQLCPVLSQQPAHPGQRPPASLVVPLLELDVEPELEDETPELDDELDELDEELDVDPPLEAPELLELLELEGPVPLLLLPPRPLLLPGLPLDELDVSLPVPDELELVTSPAAGPLSTGARPPVAHAAPTRRTARVPEIVCRRVRIQGLLPAGALTHTRLRLDLR